MKLRVPKGELTLPEDFSFEVEQNSAFFSDGGAASVAATIPATPADLAKLEQPTRIARNTRFANLFPAILQSGVFQKKGTLVVESASKDGITCAIALEDSDFYANHKEKNLKDIFAAQVLTTYSTPAAWATYLNNVYSQASTDSRFVVIPVAVDYDEEEKEYQVNNEPNVSNGSSPTIFPLISGARVVKQGGEEIGVPAGYGIAPFYRLYIFLEEIFTLCGYTVTSNCFRTNTLLNTLILLHNCSDVICKGRIDCSDLVPSKTVQEILEWLRCKFHAQIIVRPANNTVDIVLLEDIISGEFDLDLSGKVLGNLTYSFSRSSRVVITPDTSLEGAAPAAETLEELKKKYNALAEESSEMGITLDRPTGCYYENAAPLTSSYTPAKRLGTNYFSYNRYNSQEEEQLQPADLMPPMVRVGTFALLMPYIGERKHRNTCYNGSEKDEDQDIIIVDYAGLTASRTHTPSGDGTHYRRAGEDYGGRYLYGTTQKYDNQGNIRAGRYTLNAPEMFEKFFAGYNKMLRNNLVKVSGRFDLPVEDILSYGLYALKLLDGQQLLPVALRYEVGKKVRCLEASFYAVKDYADGEEDTPTIIPAPSFKWVLNTDEVSEAVNDVQGGYEETIVAVYDDEYATGEKSVFLPAPLAAGLTSMVFQRTINIGYWWESGSHNHSNMRFNTIETRTVNIWFESVAVS